MNNLQLSLLGLFIYLFIEWQQNKMGERRIQGKLPFAGSFLKCTQWPRLWAPSKLEGGNSAHISHLVGRSPALPGSRGKILNLRIPVCGTQASYSWAKCPFYSPHTSKPLPQCVFFTFTGRRVNTEL